MNLTATFTPGYQRDNGDFACAYTLYTLNGVTDFASGTVLALADNFGLTFDQATALVNATVPS